MSTLFSKTKIANTQLQEYLDYCEYRRRFTPATMKTKRQCIGKFMAQHPEVTDLRDITNNVLDAWCMQMVANGRAGKTVNNYSDHMVACLRFLQDKKGQRIRVELDKLERAEEDPAEAPYFTAEEVAQIKQHCRGLRELLLVSLIFESAMRIHEVTKLRVEDINGKIIKVVGKGRKKRMTFMLKDTRTMLDQWLMLCGISDGYVFPSPLRFGDPLSMQQVRGTINGPIRRAGFEVGSAHAVRHSSITEQLDNGMLLVDVAKIAGHSDPRTTQGYYHVAIEQLGERHARAFSTVPQG